MKQFIIKTYNAADSCEKFEFYILNKGLNSGKPLKKPCPNCFVIKLKNQNDFHFLYWLCYGLFISKKYSSFLYGSVIPYIRIGDFKKLLFDACYSINGLEDSYFKKMNILIDIEKKEIAVAQQLKLMKQLKTAMLQPFFK
jgi:hypothetical protein